MESKEIREVNMSMSDNIIFLIFHTFLPVLNTIKLEMPCTLVSYKYAKLAKWFALISSRTSLLQFC